MSDVVLAGKDLVMRFDEGPQKLEVLHGVSLEIHRGEFVAIVGSSGSGKTTLLHLLGGLDQPSSGEVFLLGKPFSKCTTAILALSTSSTTCCPSLLRWKTSACPCCCVTKA